MSDSTYKKVKEYLVQKGYHAVPDETYDHIDEWLEWYQNDVEKFHHYKLYNGAVMTNQQGCNGPVTEAIDKIQKHINKQAHDQED